MAEKLTIVCTYLLSFLVGMAVGVLILSFCSSKFCPECGHHYGSRVEYCPIDGTKLKEIVK